MICNVPVSKDELKEHVSFTCERDNTEFVISGFYDDGQGGIKAINYEKATELHIENFVESQREWTLRVRCSSGPATVKNIVWND